MSSHEVQKHQDAATWGSFGVKQYLRDFMSIEVMGLKSWAAKPNDWQPEARISLRAVAVDINLQENDGIQVRYQTMRSTNPWSPQLIHKEEAVWKYARLCDLEVPLPSHAAAFEWSNLYISAFDGSHSYSFHQPEEHIVMIDASELPEQCTIGVAFGHGATAVGFVHNRYIKIACDGPFGDKFGNKYKTVHVVGDDLLVGAVGCAGSSDSIDDFLWRYLTGKLEDWKKEGREGRPPVQDCAMYVQSHFKMMWKDETERRNKLGELRYSFMLGGYDLDPETRQFVPQLWIGTLHGVWKEATLGTLGSGSHYAHGDYRRNEEKNMQVNEHAKHCLLAAAQNDFHTGG